VFGSAEYLRYVKENTRVGRSSIKEKNQDMKLIPAEKSIRKWLFFSRTWVKMTAKLEIRRKLRVSIRHKKESMEFKLIA
jgi:hypothetical protein